MSVRVRFAPSPTGPLHLGGARTALYNDLYARACGGELILRIEDTDVERSAKEFEGLQREDLQWLGIHFHEGPYRQSERLPLYRQQAQDLMDGGWAYPCFLTEEQLDELTQKAKSEGRPFHFYHGYYRDLSRQEAQEKIKANKPYVVRFKNPQKSYSFEDLIRGPVTFPPEMVGDFVILRSNKMPVYNFCCVVDDHLMNISHVLRADDHLNNTLRQLMIYEAMGATPPQWAHFSLLVDENRQKLSKRRGGSSVAYYRQEGFLPEALANYLCLLGWSHPQEKDIFSVRALGGAFGLKRMSKSPALYDFNKILHFNREHIKLMESQAFVHQGCQLLKDEAKFQEQSPQWQEEFLRFFQDKISFLKELKGALRDIFETTPPPEALTPQERAILSVVGPEVRKAQGPFLPQESLGHWSQALKSQHGLKGRPLFQGLRRALTLKKEGPDLKTLLGLTPVSVLKERVDSWGPFFKEENFDPNR